MGKRGEKDTGEDELWERVTATAAPLRPNRRAPKQAVEQSRWDQKHAAKAEHGPKGKPVGSKGTMRSSPVAQHEPLTVKAARRLESGRIEVEARLDLHGFRQRDAHAALKRFLHMAQARGYRHVLVITGKGTMQDTPTSFYEEERRGVLRQAVPAWLAQPEFAPLVVSFAPAPRRLGGDGALYVRMRKAR